MFIVSSNKSFIYKVDENSVFSWNLLYILIYVCVQILSIESVSQLTNTHEIERTFVV